MRSYYGNQGGGTLPKDTSVAVCTIEKANSLVNRLLEEGRLSEIGIIVIDELHMVTKKINMKIWDERQKYKNFEDCSCGSFIGVFFF